MPTAMQNDRPEYFTGAERRTYLAPDLSPFVQVDDEVYWTTEVIEVLKKAGLKNRNRTRRATS